MNGTINSTWKGSEYTYRLVKSQILNRFGADAAEKYDPEVNCFTFHTWRKKGYRVKKGEKALVSTTFVKRDRLNDEGELVVNSFPKRVYLFFENQVTKV